MLPNTLTTSISPYRQYLLTTVLPKNVIETERLGCRGPCTPQCTYSGKHWGRYRNRPSHLPFGLFHSHPRFSRPRLPEEYEPPPLEPHSSQTPPSSVSTPIYTATRHSGCTDRHRSHSLPATSPPLTTSTAAFLTSALCQLGQPASTHDPPRHIRARQPSARTGHVTHPRQRTRTEGEVSRDKPRGKKSRRARKNSEEGWSTTG